MCVINNADCNYCIPIRIQQRNRALHGDRDSGNTPDHRDGAKLVLLPWDGNKTDGNGREYGITMGIGTEKKLESFEVKYATFIV